LGAIQHLANPPFQADAKIGPQPWRPCPSPAEKATERNCPEIGANGSFLVYYGDGKLSDVTQRNVLAAMDKQNMNESRWSHAYLTVMFLAFVLIPAAVYVAVVTSGSMAFVSRETGICLDAWTELYVSVGIPGFALIGSTALLLILVLGRWRNRRSAVLLSAAVLTVCILLCLHVAYASHRPFWGVLYRLH
jgi:hypothetical protein